MVIASPRYSPYFDHLHRRFAAELPLRLVVVYTHNSPRWKAADGGVYEKVFLGDERDQDEMVSTTIADHVREFRKGKRLIEVLKDCGASVFMTLGYRDPGRLRALRWAKTNGLLTFAWSDVNALGDAGHVGLRGLWKRQYVLSVDRLLHRWLVCGSRGIEYLTNYGVAANRIVRSPCEIDYSRFEKAVRADDFPVDRKRFLFCGRMVDGKRPLNVVRAFVKLAKELSEWDLIVLGDGPMLSEARQIVPKELVQRVRFEGFVRDADRVARIFAACQVLVHVPAHEPWGLVVNEAVASGLAVIASRAVGSAAELVTDGQNGLVIDHDDAPALETAMRQITQADVYARFGKASREKLRSWRKTADPVWGLREALRS